MEGGGGAACGDHAPSMPQLLSCQTHARSAAASCRQLLAPSTPVKPSCPTASCRDSLCHTSMGFSTNMPSARVLRPPTSLFVLFGKFLSDQKQSMVDWSLTGRDPNFGEEGGWIGRTPLTTNQWRGIQGFSRAEHFCCLYSITSCAQSSGEGGWHL